MKSITRALAFLLAALNIGLLAACGSADQTDTADTTAAPAETTTAETTASIPEETTDPNTVPDLEVRDWGRTLRIAAIHNTNYHSSMVSEAVTGELINDAIYERNRRIEETYGVTLKETQYEWGTSSTIRSAIQAGSDDYDIVSLSCPDALTWWTEGLIINADDLPNINLDKAYWDQSINESLSIGGTQYIAEGAFNLDSYDLTFCLVFNQALAEQNGLGDIYTLVSDGKWTMDKMEEYMRKAARDLDGNTVMNAADCWGYTAHPKMVAPGFWIGAGVTSITKDADDKPLYNLGNERFIDVFNRTFEVIWDTNAAYLTRGDNADIPTECRQIFTENRALFMDMSMFYVEGLRAMETDFGIIPYPKYDEAQDGYRSRVCYYFPTVVPMTCADPDFAGYMLEILNYESAKTVIPAYYEVTLKGKYARDEVSSQMLDTIFDSRVIDIGDSTLCDKLRDSFIFTMMETNKRNLASYTKVYEKVINVELQKMTAAK